MICAREPGGLLLDLQRSFLDRQLFTERDYLLNSKYYPDLLRGEGRAKEMVEHFRKPLNVCARGGL